MFPFERILPYIANEQCVLVIGPEIMRFEGKPMNAYLRDRLFAQYKDEIPHYYANDGLYLFPSNEDSVKSDVAQSLRKECYLLPTTVGYDEEILKVIARLPFHLIISTNPDTFLSDTFYKFGIKHRFSHYRKGERPSDEVAQPTRDEPLIYNLGGSVLEDESLVLDYEDLFSLIGSSLGASGLPLGLQSALEKTRTFVFVGFNFDKWHTQLLLRILCGKPRFRKYAGPHKINEDTQVFLANQFNIEFWENEKGGNFLETFINAATAYKDEDPNKAGRPFMRTLLEDPLLPEETTIIRDIQNAQFLKAITNLLGFAKVGKPEDLDAATHLSGRYQYLVQNQKSMDSRDFLTTLNQIADAIIQLARQIASTR
jgi:SIR2-like domain